MWNTSSIHTEFDKCLWRKMLLSVDILMFHYALNMFLCLAGDKILEGKQ